MKIGKIEIGAGRPIAIQSMTKTDTRDIAATINQIRELEALGCDIVRVAVVDMEAAAAIGKIRSAVGTPLVADIHFDYRLALECIKQGIDKIRINPGNIGDRRRIQQVADAAKERGIPIRIGVNGGSLDRELLGKYGGVTAEALVDSAVSQAEVLSMCGFRDIVVSIKSSDVLMTIEASRLFHEKKTGIPQHIGITEAGTHISGLVKSTIGLFELLRSGIGDTLRVSLTGDPIDEVIAAKNILQTLVKFNNSYVDDASSVNGSYVDDASSVNGADCAGGIDLISCPTCGRCKINIMNVINDIERRIHKIHSNKHITVAVMGCAVNGPGEAREADVGVAGGDGKALLFKFGVPQYQVPESDLTDTLLNEIKNIIQ